MINATDDPAGPSVIYFQYAKPEHAGSYKCVGTNKNGTTEMDFFVAVNVRSADRGIIAGIVVAFILVVFLLVLLVRKIRDAKVNVLN